MHKLNYLNDFDKNANTRDMHMHVIMLGNLQLIF